MKMITKLSSSELKNEILNNINVGIVTNMDIAQKNAQKENLPNHKYQKVKREEKDIIH